MARVSITLSELWSSWLVTGPDPEFAPNRYAWRNTLAMSRWVPLRLFCMVHLGVAGFIIGVQRGWKSRGSFHLLHAFHQGLYRLPGHGESAPGDATVSTPLLPQPESGHCAVIAPQR